MLPASLAVPFSPVPPLAEAVRERVVVEVGEDAFHKEIFTVREPDAFAPDGFSIRLVRAGKPSGVPARWTFDDSLLKIGRRHTLGAVVRCTAKGGASLRAEVNTRYRKKPEEFKADAACGGGRWQRVGLGAIKLERDMAVALKGTAPGGDLWLDGLYLTSDYEPANRAERDRLHAPPGGYLPRDRMIRGVMLRLKGGLSRDPFAALDRQVLDIAASGADTIMLAGSAKDPPDSRDLIERVLALGDELGVRIVIPLEAIVPAEVVDRFGPTREWTKDLAQRTRSALEGPVASFRKHPSLSGYFPVDEPYPHLLTRLSGLQKILHELDPGHPVVEAFQSPHQLHTFGRVFPVASSGIYPYRGQRGPAVALAVRDFMSAIRPLVSGPFWPCLQGFTEGGGERVTRAQYRFLAWRLIMGGADGFIHYPYFPHHRVVVSADGTASGSAENYGFINAIERPYEGEHDLWVEAGALNRRLAAVGPLLAGAEIIAPADLRVESETIETAAGRSPAVDSVVFKSKSGIGVIMLQNLDLTAKRRARVEGREIWIEPGDAAFHLRGDPARAAAEEKAMPEREKDFDLVRVRVQVVAARRSGVDLSAFDRAVEARDLAAARSALDRVLAKEEIRRASDALESAARPLSRIEAVLKERLVVRQNVTPKMARRRGEQHKREMSGSEKVLDLDKEFASLASDYLEARTHFLRGRFADAARLAAPLAGMATALEKRVAGTGSQHK